MLSKQKIKLFRLLQQKKCRYEKRLFIVEGEKMVNEAFRSSYCIDYLIATNKWLNQNHKLIRPSSKIEVMEADKKEIQRISSLTTSQDVVAVLKMPNQTFNFNYIGDNLILFLDSINDPGNLGTILRIADWFGIENVVCSANTVDLFNPKTIQATMGAIFRVKVFYTETSKFFQQLQENVSNTDTEIPVYGAFLNGENIYHHQLSNHGIIVLGSESHGVLPDTQKNITQKIYIPKYPVNKATAESLNVSMAAAIICSEFRRR